MTETIRLRPQDRVRLDETCLSVLLGQMGAAAAEATVQRAVADLDCRLDQCQRLWRRGDRSGLRKTARAVAAIAAPIGMTGLARVAWDVTVALDRDDPVAVAAVLARLQRIGDLSLCAVWDLRASP